MSDGSSLSDRALDVLRRALERVSASDEDATRLLLVRHGENRPRGSGADFTPDPRLSERGEQQARRLARALEDEPVDGLYTSPLRRTRGTARILGERLGTSPEPLDAFREIARGPGPPAEEPDRFAAAGRWDALEGFESDRSLRGRVAEGSRRLLRRHRGGCVVVVTHMMPINALLAERLESRRSFFFHPAPTSVTEMRLDETRTFLVRLDDTAHLEGKP